MIAYVANSRPNKLSKTRPSEGILCFSSSNQASSNLSASFFDSWESNGADRSSSVKSLLPRLKITDSSHLTSASCLLFIAKS